MATPLDIQQYIEARLLAYDSSIDLSSGSPVQSAVVSPLVSRFGEDPLATDALSFVQSVVSQAFPDLGVTGGGVSEDIFNCISLLLEPLRRGIEEIRIGQSVRNADLMSDDQADALADNFFASRREGAKVRGPVRLYFVAPTSTSVGVDNRCSSGTGNFYAPIGGYSLSASQMVFNRQGSLYFMDITVEAESEGAQYNVATGGIDSIEGLPAVIKVANLSDFTAGDDRQNSVDFLSNLPNQLSERSLGTARGLTARIADTFPQDIRSVRVVGAGDVGMDRDILTGSGEGLLYTAGTALAFGDWILQQSIIYKDDGVGGTVVMEVGDKVRFHVSSDYLTLPAGATDVHESSILAMYPIAAGSPLNLLIMDRQVSIEATKGRFAVFKPAQLTISGTPGGMLANDIVPDGEVHIGGHFDVFARPVADTEAAATLKVSDDDPIVILTDLSVEEDPDSPGMPSNLVKSNSADFTVTDLDIKAGLDVLEIESGDAFIGSYQILEVGEPDNGSLRLATLFTSTAPYADGYRLRGRLARRASVDLVSPKTVKYPFIGSEAADLQLLIGSTVFRTGTDLTTSGVVVGDILEVTKGAAAGKYAIKGFDAALGGFGPIVDRGAPLSATGVLYKVYSAGTGISLPLVRVRSVELMDSSGQATGMKVPYGLPVDARAPDGLLGAGSATTIYGKDLLLFPDGYDAVAELNLGSLDSYRTYGELTGFALDPTVREDARYSLRQATFNVDTDIVRQVAAMGGNLSDITKYEILLEPWLWSGRNDKVLAYTTRKDPEFLRDSSGNARTSEFARLKSGDTFRILDGANAGAYTIRKTHTYDLWKRASGAAGHEAVTIMQVDPPLKTSPLKTAINLINHVYLGVESELCWSKTDYPILIAGAADPGVATCDPLVSIGLPTRLSLALQELGVDPTLATVEFAEELVASVGKVSYQVGPAARGPLRVSFLEPATVEFYSGDDPTEFSSGVSERKLRLDPAIPPSQILPESDTKTAPTAWLRDIGTTMPGSLYLHSTAGRTLAAAGIRPGDVLEFHRAVNDVEARKTMVSSRICTTRSGSPVVQLVLPASSKIKNFAAPEEGQLLFIESGPDAGGYTIMGIEEPPNWSDPVPTVRVRLERPMTYTTAPFPADAQNGLTYGVQAQLRTSGNSYPLSGLYGKKISLYVSMDGGATWLPESCTLPAFPAFSVSSILSLMEYLNDNWDVGGRVVAFAGPMTSVTQGELILRVDSLNHPLTRICLAADHTAGAAGASYTGLLHFLETKATAPPVDDTGASGATIRKGVLGFTCGSGSDCVYTYGSPSNFPVESYLHIYAARGTDVLGTTDDYDSDDAPYLGTFKILNSSRYAVDDGFANLMRLELERDTPFPELTVEDVELYCVCTTNAPLTPPINATGGGKELSTQFVRFRMYDEVALQSTVAAYPWDQYHPLDPASTKQLRMTNGDPTLVDSGGYYYGHRAPYRALRSGVVRKSATAMASQREGGLYYMDVPVVGYGPDADMNILADEPFEISGRHSIDGYTLASAKKVHSYSTLEEVKIILPPKILPAGFSPGTGKEITLPSRTAQVKYDWAPVVAELQQFLSSPLERPQAANILARHYLPAYVFMEGSYYGGSDPSAVAADLIKYIRSLNPNYPRIQVDDVIDAIRKRQASRVALPVTVLAVVHGADRKLAVLRSADFIGSGQVPNFDGTFEQLVFIPGADASGQNPRPDGEQIYLTRL